MKGTTGLGKAVVFGAVAAIVGVGILSAYGLWNAWKMEHAIEAMLKAIRSDDLSALIPAILEVHRTGGTREAVTELSAMLRSEKAVERELAAATIGEFSIQAESVVQGLTGLLDDEDSDVRREAAMALGKIGEPAQTAVDSLVVAMNREKDEPQVSRRPTALLSPRQAMREAVQRIDPDAAATLGL